MNTVSRVGVERSGCAIYQIGDMVVHPGHGGCTVKNICDKEYGGQSKQYYVLEPKTEPNTTILAPVENIQKIGLRDVMSEQQADQVLELLSTAPADWVKDSGQRRQAYDKALRGGDLGEIARMIKELRAQETRGSLNQHDREMLPRAQKKLLSEIALAKGIEFEGAMNLMDTAMQLA